MRNEDLKTQSNESASAAVGAVPYPLFRWSQRKLHRRANCRRTSCDRTYIHIVTSRLVQRSVRREREVHVGNEALLEGRNKGLGAAAINTEHAIAPRLVLGLLEETKCVFAHIAHAPARRRVSGVHSD